MADTKLTALTENTAPISTDLVYMVDDPAGSPLSQKATYENASKALVADNIPNTPAGDIAATNIQAAIDELDAEKSPLAGSSNIVTVGTIATGTWEGDAVGDSYISSAATWNAKQAALAFGIADTNSVVIDSASVANAEYAKFTANGLESKTFAEVKTDLSLNNVENTALSTWAGSANITTTGVITSGTLGAGAVLAGVTMTLGSDADGDTYYRSSNVLTRVSKGTATQVYTMNAGATAPEWADATGGSTFGDVIEGTAGAGLDINTNSNQATGTVRGTTWGTFNATSTSHSNFNINSSFNATAHYIVNVHNSGTGENTGIIVSSKSTDRVVTDSSEGFIRGPAIVAYQGAKGTAVDIRAYNSSLPSTTGLLNISATNTQTSAGIAAMIDLGTSAQAHTGLYVKGSNASTTAKLAHLSGGSGFTGKLLELQVTNTSSAQSKMINFETPSPLSNGTGYLGSFMKFSDNIDHAHPVSLIDFTVSQNDGNSGNNINRTETMFNWKASLYAANGSNGAQTANYSMAKFSRNDQQANAAGTYTAQGAVVEINHLVFNPAGAIVDTSSFLKFSQGGNQTHLWNGRLIEGALAFSANTFNNRTNPYAEFSQSRENTATSGTLTDNFNLGEFKRTSIQNGAGGTLSAQGSVIYGENVVTQTAGTLTDDTTVLELVQDNDSTGGHIRFNTYSGTPTTDNTLWFDGTDLKIRVSGTTYTLTKS